MRFNANRLARLAGLPGGTSSRRRSLNEAGNRSRDDEGYDDGYDWYRKQLAEGDKDDDAEGLWEEDAGENPFAEGGKGDEGDEGDEGLWEEDGPEKAPEEGLWEMEKEKNEAEEDAKAAKKEAKQLKEYARRLYRAGRLNEAKAAAVEAKETETEAKSLEKEVQALKTELSRVKQAMGLWEEDGPKEDAEEGLWEDGDSASDDDDAKAVDDLDEMVYINESMLRQEIARMKRARTGQARQSQSLQERQLRDAIRNEIKSITADSRLNSTRDWLYGDNKPRNSRKGYVARGGFGIGF